MLRAYEINAPAVSSEIIDGEAIVLHLKSGHYFSMAGSAALIWAGVERQIPVCRIVSIFAERYGLTDAMALRDVEGLLAKLVEHDLVRLATSAVEDKDAAGIVLNEDGRYEPPQLHVYTDLQDLLLLDPIHDVDDAGWPMAPGRAGI